ncbi:Ras-related protein Rab-5C [Nematocida sp. LUAm3]|nr:Ras-related protein Rab-5C [Nematocida sp. LUAm3]KAI5174692.1 Ras-related protein Rab-5C [Nematocida sp. LUAm2]
MENRGKIVVLGGCGSGKSSVTKKFLNGAFDPNHPTTIGAAYHTKTVTRNNEKIHFDIWDTAGQERYGAIAPMYYRDAHTVIVVYDVLDMESLKIAKRWCKEVRIKNKSALMMVFGNKTDLIANAISSPGFLTGTKKDSEGFQSFLKSTLRTIDAAGIHFKEYNAQHFCGSAKNGEGVSLLFNTIFNESKYSTRVTTPQPSWWCF